MTLSRVSCNSHHLISCQRGEKSTFFPTSSSQRAIWRGCFRWNTQLSQRVLEGHPLGEAARLSHSLQPLRKEDSPRGGARRWGVILLKPPATKWTAEHPGILRVSTSHFIRVPSDSSSDDQLPIGKLDARRKIQHHSGWRYQKRGGSQSHHLCEHIAGKASRRLYDKSYINPDKQNCVHPITLYILLFFPIRPDQDFDLAACGLSNRTYMHLDLQQVRTTTFCVCK